MPRPQTTSDIILTRALRILAAQVDRRLIALLAVLSLASATTESIGLVLLVPILGIMSGAATLPPALAGIAAFSSTAAHFDLLLLIFVSLVTLRAVLNYWRALVALTVQRNLVDGLRMRAWRGLLHCDWRVLSSMRQSENASLLITTIDRVGMGIDRVIGGAVTVVTLLGVGAASLAISPTLTAAAVVGGTLVLIAYRRLRQQARSLGGALDDVYDRIHAELTEGLGALRVIKSFGAERATEHRLRDELATLYATERSFVRGNGRGQLVMQIASAGFLALAIWISVRYWHLDMVTLLPMVALFARGLPLLMALQGCMQDWAHTRPAIDTAISLIERTEAAREPDHDADLQIAQAVSTIGLRDVTVHYPGRARPALNAISLDLPVCTVTALTGPSGAGKSTLADVIGGLLTPDSGELLIDGNALDFAMRRTWRSHVTYVQQMPVLFTGTVRDNLLWAQPHTDDRALEHALAEASADFVLRLPHGLDTIVGENGHQFSGGERQRLILARAMLRAPDLLILDEAASALDRENDEAIARAVLRLGQRCTVLVIAHGGALQAIASREVRIVDGTIA